MNALDIIFAVILGFSLIRGIFRGLVKEVASIIGVLSGYYAAYTYYPLVARLLSRWMSDTAYLNIVSFLILFCLVFIIISMIGVVLKYLLSIAYMGWADRLSGALFGLTKAILVASVILVALTTFLPKNAALVRESLLAPYVTHVSENIAKMVSPEMKRTFSGKMDALKASWKGGR
ncbi:MAG: CvpA family protein [Pseudomonadota bacterium]